MSGEARVRPVKDVGYANPLTLTLSHYTRELADTLDRCGVNARELPTRRAEGYSGLPGKVRMLTNALANVRTVRSGQSDLTLSLWPTLGLFEIPLYASSRRVALVLHDPDPITDQFGYGSAARWLANAVGTERAPLIVVHSLEAWRDANRMLPRADIVVLPHPVESPVRVLPPAKEPIVIVAGQFKPTRNVELLNQLGPMLRADGIEPRVVGRGWSGRLDPSWATDDRFLTEGELEAELARAVAVLIPYNRYYQSGIAVRAVELGSRVVGEENSFLRSLLGGSSDVLPAGSGPAPYLAAIRAAVAADRGTAFEIYDRYRAHVDDTWSSFLNGSR